MFIIQTSTASKVAGGLLALTGVLGIVILAADQNLWKFAPTHAYALIVFVIIDFASGTYVLTKPSKTGFMLAAVWSALRILLQLADISQGPDLGFSYADFADYLFNPVATFAPNPTGVPGALIDLIIILEIVVIGVAWTARSSTQK